jgi:hypothetical protein
MRSVRIRSVDETTFITDRISPLIFMQHICFARSGNCQYCNSRVLMFIIRKDKQAIVRNRDNTGL